MANLKLEHIYKTYAGGVTAVSDFCLDIEDKEFIVLVGPSGCGKTTTGRSIIKLYDITSGSVYFKGQRVGAGTRSSSLFEDKPHSKYQIFSLLHLNNHLLSNLTH